jgi:hypothetical protein
MRRSVVIILFATLAIESAFLAARLDADAGGWADKHPFLFTLVGALLTVPLTAFVATAVVEALLTAHERARARQVYEARVVRLGIVVNTTLNVFAKAFLDQDRGAAVADPHALGRLLAVAASHLDRLQEVHISREPGTRGPFRAIPDTMELQRAAVSYEMLAGHFERMAEAGFNQDWLVLADDMRLVATSQAALNSRWEDARHKAEGPSESDWQLLLYPTSGVVHQLADLAEQFKLPSWSWPDPRESTSARASAATDPGSAAWVGV